MQKSALRIGVNYLWLYVRNKEVTNILKQAQKIPVKKCFFWYRHPVMYAVAILCSFKKIKLSSYKCDAIPE